MAKYNLTNSLERTFSFSIDDKEFLFTKPTVRQMREISRKYADISSEENPDVQDEKTQAAMRSLYAHISPVGHDSNIEDVMNDQTLDVQFAFNEMIQKELGAK